MSVSGGAGATSNLDKGHEQSRALKRVRIQSPHVREVQLLLEDISDAETEMRSAASEVQRMNAQVELRQLQALLKKMAPNTLAWIEWMEGHVQAARRMGDDKEVEACKRWQTCLNAHAFSKPTQQVAVA